MSRVISYIDGFNFYFGLKSKGWKKYYWLNLAALSQVLLKSDQTLVHCHYFTARIRHKGSSQNADRQSMWLDAIDTLPNLTTHFGHYLSKQKKCKKCSAQWVSYEEKMTDVNIAAQLLIDAYEDRFDTALIISGDSDLTTPIKWVRERFPNKRIIVAFPPGRYSDQLKKAAHGNFPIGQDKLRNNLMPNQIQKADGYTLVRPTEWY